MQKNSNEMEPIKHGTEARPHTPIYKMHRYFARRPWSVFNYLIKHYSEPDQIVMDPMMGGGVPAIDFRMPKPKTKIYLEGCKNV